MKYLSITSIFVLLISLVSAEFFPPTSTWENVNYGRTIELSRSYVKDNHDLTIKNIATEPVQIYYFAVQKQLKDDVSIFLPTLTKSGKVMALVATELDETFEDLAFFKIQLPFPVAPKASISFHVSIILTNQLAPLPAEVDEMQSSQSLVYYTNKLPLSIYPTVTYELSFIGFQSTVDEIPVPGISEELLSKYTGKPVGDKLVYGPYDLSKDEPLVQLPMSLLFNRRAPLLHVNKLSREVWISHWSEALQVEEHYQVTNKGVALKNGFSRVEYMKKKIGQTLNPSISTIDIPIVDSEASEFYYTDLVGNVSTSLIYENSLILKPRYPIFGGWNYNFTIGWTSNLKNYVHSIGNDEFIAKVPIISGPRDCSYTTAEFQLYLPAGAKIISVDSPIEYEDYEVDEFYSYLDTLKGHTRISLKFENLVDEMRNVQILVKYSYTPADKFSKIFSISLYVFIALISFIGIKLIDIRIDTTKRKLA